MPTHEEQLREALREIRDDYDHDEDAHKYGTRCRCCIADAALSGKREGAATDSQLGFSPPASDSGPGPDHRDGPATNREQSAASAAREADVRTLLGPTSEGGSGRVSAAAEVGAEARRAEWRLTLPPEQCGLKVPSPELEALLQRAVQQKDEEERKLAAMTPEQRARYIEEWAARVAPQLVEEGCAIDRALNAPAAPEALDGKPETAPKEPR